MSLVRDFSCIVYNVIALKLLILSLHILGLHAKCQISVVLSFA